MRRSPVVAALLLTACVLDVPAAGPAPFFVEVVDDATGRGVPLVELESVHGVTFVTDNGGVAVIDEPDWVGAEIWLHVRSHGYHLAADGFGYRGVRVVVTPGGSRTIRLERDNLAERLHRITGADRWRDSRRIGRPVPADDLPGPPLGRGGVLGQDSVQNAVYRGRLYWFWGDTNRASYPLGNFATAGATSALPAAGLDPTTDLALDYFVGADGFARPMCPLDGPGPVWIDGVVVLDVDGRETMLCHYARMRDLGTRHEHGIARWNDDAQRFDKLVELPLRSTLHPAAHPLRVSADDGGDDWLYFCNPYPALRVRARLEALVEPSAYEGFSCLVAGAEWPGSAAAAAPLLDRDAAGALRWGWKAATAPVAPRKWRELVAAGVVADGEGFMNLVDVETGARVIAHAGHVCWNAYRRRWVMLFTEQFGRSMLGEVWYAEAADLAGPWDRARRIVTHDDYSFYNVAQHPELAAGDGRYLWFEGTYTRTFSGAPRATPRYDYNQIMYRLDLADPRLRLAP